MQWDEDALYRQFLRRDLALNGKFLTGVLTTGIYCLPSCPARRPKRENVRFFRTPDEAQRSGLRPCRRCRPDFFYGGAEWHESLFEQTVARVRRAPAAVPDVGALASLAGMSRTALNDLFREHGHESPAAFLRRARVEHAAGALANGEKPVSAQQAAGFESSSAFHDQFVRLMAMTPGAYSSLGSAFTLRLPARYRAQEILDYFARDAEALSEHVDGRTLRKCFCSAGGPSVLTIRFDGDLAHCENDASDVYAAHRIALRLTGLTTDSAAFERRHAGDRLLGALLRARRGLRIALTPDVWEALAWAITGQQVSLKAAVTMRRELIRTAGTPHASGLRAHPTAAQVAALDAPTLRSLKFSGSKAEYLLNAARAGLPLGEEGISARRAARLLSGVRGIGPWTVEYVLLRGYGFADALPSGDAGLAQGLEKLCGARPGESAIREQLAAFAPYRSLATCHIWASLKGDPHAN
jgi:AraC family transcriptional regulator of adaptative response / DNA-3-methyladenine glycosylase II